MFLCLLCGALLSLVAPSAGLDSYSGGNYGNPGYWSVPPPPPPPPPAPSVGYDSSYSDQYVDEGCGVLCPWDLVDVNAFEAYGISGARIDVGTASSCVVPITSMLTPYAPLALLLLDEEVRGRAALYEEGREVLDDVQRKVKYMLGKVREGRKQDAGKSSSLLKLIKSLFVREGEEEEEEEDVEDMTLSAQCHEIVKALIKASKSDTLDSSSNSKALSVAETIESDSVYCTSDMYQDVMSENAALRSAIDRLTSSVKRYKNDNDGVRKKAKSYKKRCRVSEIACEKMLINQEDNESLLKAKDGEIDELNGLLGEERLGRDRDRDEFEREKSSLSDELSSSNDKLEAAKNEIIQCKSYSDGLERRLKYFLDKDYQQDDDYQDDRNRNDFEDAKRGEAKTSQSNVKLSSVEGAARASANSESDNDKHAADDDTEDCEISLPAVDEDVGQSANSEPDNGERVGDDTEDCEISLPAEEDKIVHDRDNVVLQGDAVVELQNDTDSIQDGDKYQDKNKDEDEDESAVVLQGTWVNPTSPYRVSFNEGMDKAKGWVRKARKEASKRTGRKGFFSGKKGT